MSGQENDLINRQAAIQAILDMRDCYNGFSDTFDKAAIIGMLEEVPSAVPETAKRIVGKSRSGITMWYECGVCDEPVDQYDAFCRGCGRRLIDE